VDSPNCREQSRNVGPVNDKATVVGVRVDYNLALAETGT
jgi:hypothetical protein